MIYRYCSLLILCILTACSQDAKAPAAESKPAKDAAPAEKAEAKKKAEASEKAETSPEEAPAEKQPVEAAKEAVAVKTEKKSAGSGSQMGRSRGPANANKAPPAAPADYYVSVSGADDNPGTLDQPFRTIQKAAEVARPGQEVAVMEGTYRESVRPKHSGQDGKPIIFRNHGQDKVVISGADVVPNWKKGGRRWSAKWGKPFKSKNNLAMQLFVDGKMMNETRYPNMEFDISRPARLHVDEILHWENLGNNKYRFTIRCDAFQEPKGKWDGGRINIRSMWKWGWGMPRTGDIEKSKPGELTFTMENYDEHKPENGSATVVRAKSDVLYGSPFYVFRSLKGLDHPGEWHFDTKSGYIGLVPVEGVDPSEALIEVKMRDWAFDLSERSHITVKGFHLFACSITTDVDSGTGIGEMHPNSQIRGGDHSGLKMIASASHITIDDVHARYVTHFTNLDGYVLSQWSNNSGIVLSGRNHVLQNSTVGYSAGNGVSVLGENHKVLNNIFYIVGYSGCETGGIGTSCFKTYTRDCEFAYNTIYTVAGNGIHSAQLKSKDDKNPSSFHHNLIADVGTMRCDVGFIYAFGGRDGSMNDFSYNVMYGNTTFQGFGIYLDYANDWFIHHNVVFDASWANCMHTNQQGGHNVKWYNNTLWGLGHAVNGHKHASARQTELKNNILHGQLRTLPDQVAYENNVKFDREYVRIIEFFEDPYGLDFTPKYDPGKELFEDKGQELPPFTDGFVQTAPDAGAVEIGGGMFRVGSNLPPIVAAPTHLQASSEGNKVQLRWKDHADNEEHYILERSTQADTGYMFNVAWEVIATLPPNTTTYEDKKKGGLTYYRVRAPESRPTNMVAIY